MTTTSSSTTTTTHPPGDPPKHTKHVWMCCVLFACVCVSAVCFGVSAGCECHCAPKKTCFSQWHSTPGDPPKHTAHTQNTHTNLCRCVVCCLYVFCVSAVCFGVSAGCECHCAPKKTCFSQWHSTPGDPPKHTAHTQNTHTNLCRCVVCCLYVFCVSAVCFGVSAGCECHCAPKKYWFSQWHSPPGDPPKHTADAQKTHKQRTTHRHTRVCIFVYLLCVLVCLRGVSATVHKKHTNSTHTPQAHQNTQQTHKNTHTCVYMCCALFGCFLCVCCVFWCACGV